MRWIVALLVFSATAFGEVPFVVTRAPKFTANACLPSAVHDSPRCVKVNGVDEDLDALLKHYRREWTWPGMTEATLRGHLREHGVSDFERLSFAECRQLHAVIHERELVAKSAQRVQSRSTCPGGVCPAPVLRRQARWGVFR